MLGFSAARGPPLPSSESAYEVIDRVPGSIPKAIFYTAMRAGLIGAGMALAGERNAKNLAKYALSGAAAIEIFALVWAAKNRRDER